MKIYIKKINEVISLREKSILLILSILSIIFIALFFVITPSFITENGEAKHFEDNDYSFDMSNSWTVNEYDDFLKTPFLSSSPNSIIVNPVDTNQFSYYNGSVEDLTANGSILNTSTTNATDVVIVKTEITKHDSLPDGITLDDAYKSDSLYSLMYDSGKFEMVNDSAMMIDGKNAHQFNYRVSYVTYQDTWIESNGHYIRILNQAPNSVFDNAAPQFDYLLNTFKVK